ncbi:MAG: Beta helix protein, partial [Bacteroidota bacterium]|nr:Beta helix protein [Bacteroidota bacterium]
SAGIRTAIGTVYHEFDDNEISECNWGIFLDGTIYSQVNNCRIVNMKKYKDKDDESGIGIMIYPSSIGLEANQIGFKKGNYVYNCDKYGLCIGVEGMEKFIDNTKIQNNTFEANNEFGVAIRDLKGIGDFSKNVFKNNNASLLILGFPMDLWIGDNKFEESAGKTEIETSNKYDGAYLYDLWTANGNKFAKSFAAVNKNREIVAVGDKRYIRSIEPMAREDAGSDNKVESKP